MSDLIADNCVGVPVARLACPASGKEVMSYENRPCNDLKALMIALCVMGLFLLTGIGAMADNIFTAGYANNPINPNLDGAIYEFNSSGQPTIFASGLEISPYAMALDSSGNLYAQGYNSILEFNSSGQSSVFETGVQVGGMAFDNNNGNLYAISGTNILQFNSSGQYSIFASVLLNFSGQGSANHLAIDNLGNLYVSLIGMGIIEKFNSSGIGSIFASGLISPRGLAVDSQNNVYVTGGGGGTPPILKFTPNGQQLSYSGYGTGLYNPQGLACDSGGNVFAVDNDPNLSPEPIYRFDTNGNAGIFANLGDFNYLPGGIAIQQTPEPTTSTMIALGCLAFLGLRACALHRTSQRCGIA
jgi:hypothetical protein